MNTTIAICVARMAKGQRLTRNDFLALLDQYNEENRAYLGEMARDARLRTFGPDIYVRALIELTNYCVRNCRYCGIRRDNAHCERYRLTDGQVLACCERAYGLGFRTFVLQGGEDPYYTDQRLSALVRAIAARYTDCAITLSLGERSRDSYKRLYEAGANRYLLRHETANPTHFALLHPPEQTLTERMRCLYDLQDIGYQVGCGFMVGSPGQAISCIADDLMFLQAFKPAMVGIGPFLPHRQTPFASEKPGSAPFTLYLLSIIRLLLPHALLPATTALNTVDESGREDGILAGANVVMPNFTPRGAREKYLLYDGKDTVKDEASDGLRDLKERLSKIGCRVAVTRGDYRGEETT